MRFTHFLAISLCGIANVACQMDEIEVPREELFTRAFIKEFGIPDPDQDWNVATRVTANVDPALVRGAETICVYDCMPGGPDCQLAARFSASTTSFDFDFAKGNTSAYVRGENANGSIVFSGFYPIRNGQLILSSGSHSRAIEYENASAIKLQKIAPDNEWGKGIGKFDPNKRYDEWETGWSCNFEYWKALKGQSFAEAKEQNVLEAFPLYGMYTGSSMNESYLKGVYNDEEEGTPCSALTSIVGKKGIFHEGVVDKRCNLNRYGSLLKPEEGVIYRSEGGEIILKYLYGAGIFANSFGYFYYEDGATTQQIMEAPKFLLMYDASPWNNLQREGNNGYENFGSIGGYGIDNSNIEYVKGIDNFSGMRTANDVLAYEEKNGPDIKYRPSYHKLVYYQLDSNGLPIESTATYTFPKGMNIGFFIMVQGHEKMKHKGDLTGIGNTSNKDTWKVEGTDVRFSIPWMNQLMGAYYSSVSDHGNTTYKKYKLEFNLNNGNSGEIKDEYTPHMSFVTFAYNGHTVLGVEDGPYHSNDHDVNDILFYVEGVNDGQQDIGKDPIVQSWIVACEDLGSFHDFDFNDVVFGLSYFATDKDEDRCLKVKALAAGGTLPVQLMWTDPNGNQHDLGAENGYNRWNNWFGVTNENQVINCNHNRDYQFQGATVTIDLKDFPDYSISPDSYLNDGEGYPMGGFSIGVYEDGSYKFSREVRPLGNYSEGAESWSKTPQMILLHHTWRWPIENKPIFDAYSGGTVTGSDKYEKQAGFRDWIKDKYNIEWTSLPSDTEVVVEHNWNGEKFTSGSKQ